MSWPASTQSNRFMIPQIVISRCEPTETEALNSILILKKIHFSRKSFSAQMLECIQILKQFIYLEIYNMQRKDNFQL